MRNEPIKIGLSREDLVYQVSRWQRYLYDCERDLNPDVRRAERAGGKRHQRYPDFNREVFSRLYNPRTKMLDPPSDGSEWAQRLHSEMGSLPEFQMLQSRCKGDEIYSGMASNALSKGLLAKTADIQPPTHDVDQLKRKVAGLEAMQDGGRVDRQLARARTALAKAKREAQEAAEGMDGVAIRQAVRQACERAQDEISSHEQAVEAYSYGSEPGTPAQVSAQEKRELASKIQGSPKLSEIARMAGRLRRIAAEKQRSKTADSRAEVTDIEQGDDLARMLAGEAAYLNDPDLELLFARKLVEHSLVQYRLSGREEQGRGPIVMLVDVSGSMAGDRDVTAKATALAMLDIATRQKRTWALVQFDSKIQKVDTFRCGQCSSAALMDAMGYFSGGGTNYQEPLSKAVELIRGDGGFRRADIVMVTDGYCGVEQAFLDEFKKQKTELEFSLYSVLINTGSSHALDQISDRVWPISELTADSVQDVIYKV